MMKASVHLVYVRILHQNCLQWHPVRAIHLHGSCFRLCDESPDPDHFAFEFQEDENVFCGHYGFAEGEIGMVALECCSHVGGHSPTRSLALELDRFLDWLKHLAMPAFEKILFIDGVELYALLQITSRIEKSNFQTEREYEMKFNQLLAGGFSWINLSAVGVCGTSLILMTELPQQACECPLEKVAVNISGPPISQGWFVPWSWVSSGALPA